MDVGTQNFRQTQLVHHGIEAFCFFVAAVRDASTMKKWMCSVRPRLWKNVISWPTHFDLAEWGEQMTMRFCEAFSRSCNSAVKPPGWISVGAKNTGLMGVRFYPCSLHTVVGMR